MGGIQAEALGRHQDVLGSRRSRAARPQHTYRLVEELDQRLERQVLDDVKGRHHVLGGVRQAAEHGHGIAFHDVEPALAALLDQRTVALHAARHHTVVA